AEARLEVRGEGPGAQAVRADAGVRMPSLADEVEPVAEATRGHPPAEEPLGAAELVGGGEVEAGAAGLQQRIEPPELALAPRAPGERAGRPGARARRARQHRGKAGHAAPVTARPPPGPPRSPAVRGAPR